MDEVDREALDEEVAKSPGPIPPCHALISTEMNRATPSPGPTTGMKSIAMDATATSAAIEVAEQPVG